MNHEIPSINAGNRSVGEFISLNWSTVRWGWVGLGVVIAFVIAHGSSICVVTGHATYLSFQVRGAPDMALINDFAAKTAGVITSVFIGVGTFVGGLRAGRKAQVDAFQNGLMVGLITAFIDLALSIFGGFSLLGVVSFILAIGGGWLAGKRSSQ